MPILGDFWQLFGNFDLKKATFGSIFKKKPKKNLILGPILARKSLKFAFLPPKNALNAKKMPQNALYWRRSH